MVDAVECQCSGQSEGVCGGIGCDGNVLHLHGGVTGIAVTIWSDLCHTHSSRECQVDRCSDDQLGSVECKGITVQLGSGQCFDITLVSCDGEFSGSCQRDVISGDKDGSWVTIGLVAVAGHATCYAMNKITGEVNRQILRCG